MAETDRAWTLYAHHRARLTEAILATSGARGGRLCLLGAGECNDVDLERLSRAFSEIHLVDIEAGALAKAVARQAPPVRARLRPHARVDLSGVDKRLGKWKRRPPSVAQLDEVRALTWRSLLARLPGPFDVVASACVLTQMSFAVRSELGDACPMMPVVRQSVVATHMDTLVGLTAGGGDALFVSDLSSSSLFPVQAIEPSRDLRDIMNELVASGVCYHSANPMLIAELLNRRSLRGLIGEPSLLDPWLWTGMLGRTYFVYALRIPRLA